MNNNFIFNFILIFFVILTKEVKTWKSAHLNFPKFLEKKLSTENLEPRKYFLPPIEPKFHPFLPPVEPKLDPFLPPIVPKSHPFLPPIEPKQSEDIPIDPFEQSINQHSKLPKKCGDRSVESDEATKIVNGHKVLYGELPWQARFLTMEERAHFCGGTIISEFIIISAAHCFKDENYDPTKFYVRVGDYEDDLYEMNEEAFTIEKVVGHEDYNPKTMDNDIAIVKIKATKGKGIEFGKYVQPACLVEENEKLPIGKKCLVSGWGDLGGHIFPSSLQSTDIQIMNQAYCRKAISYGAEITDNMFCAGDKKGSTDSCQGDSGGPLVCNYEGKFTLFGVVSWGNGCAKPRYPGIYTKVSKYHQWIEDNID